MATLTLDLSGSKGLVPQAHGDVNGTQNINHRYIGAEGQMASGYYNPIKKYGYLSPAVDSLINLSGTISAPINSINYDEETNDVFITQVSNTILKLDGLDDTSLSTYLTLTSAYDVLDSRIYELNGNKALFYVIDSTTAVSAGGNGLMVGFNFLDTANNATALDSGVNILTTNVGFPNSLVRLASETGPKGRKLAQQFYSDDLEGLQISGIDLMLSREGGTGSGITIKVSIQTEASPSTSPYTSRGAWGSGVSYAKNDTVTNGGFTWQCWAAHTSAAGDEPGVGANWENYWNRFGAPSGTELTSGTIAATAISNLATTDDDRVSIIFTTPITLTAATLYWIVVEESGSNMGASDEIAWKTTINDNGTYDRHAKTYYQTNNYWRDTNFNGDTLTLNHDNFDFRLNVNASETWSKDIAYGKFTQERGDDTFLHLSDNALLYWVVGNKIHTIDGSLTGGEYGKISEGVLQFPAYINIVDIAETRSRMYIGVQSSERVWLGSVETYTATVCGIYVWDRKSQVAGGAELYPCPGAMSINKLFTGPDGDVYAITVNNSGQAELRAASGNQFKVLRLLPYGAWPMRRRSVDIIDGLAVWLGFNGTIYAFGPAFPGEENALFTFGSISDEFTYELISGALFSGNSLFSLTSRLNGIHIAATDFANTHKLFKWIPHGEGTISSVAQTSRQGDIYTKVNYLPSLSTIRTATIYVAPTTTTTGATNATVKFYKNQSTTPFSTKTITDSMCNKGYVHFNLNEHNCNALQIEIEYPETTITAGTLFHPSIAIIDYEPTKTRSPDQG